ncbi:DMT family transporter [Pseudomonas benzenivorans]|uniref:DMT family transporter n=1 Tax=Pseudomonas benzenivorans TaxID=556533 RepID=A0ABY5HB01_9PSED|nr:DMT family transporter [Pseudomonas benzenivorans]UTW08181.1 DMT family transporter [Pseudomonas benzenivorans]
MNQVSHTAAHSGMALWAVLITSSFYAAAEVTGSVDPIFLTALRLAFSAVLFLPLVFLRGEASLSRSHLAGHAWLGLLLAVYFASLFEALRHTSVVTTALLFTLVPLMTLGIELRLIPSANSRGRIMPMLMGASGAALLIIGRAGHVVVSEPYPILVYAAGCLAMAVYSPLSQWLKKDSLRQRSPVGMTFWNMLFGAVFLLGYTFYDGGWRTAALLDVADIGWLFYLALFATLGTFWLLHRATASIAPATVISYIYLSTLITTACHWFWFKQTPVILEITGALMVGFGMFALFQVGKRRGSAAA